MKKQPLLIAASILALAVPTAAQAATPTGADRFTPAQGVVDAKVLPRSLQDDSKVNVIVEMAGDPVAVVEAEQGDLSASQKKKIRANLKAKQDAVTGDIKSHGGKVTAQMQSAYNGVAVTIKRKEVKSLAALPGVVAVHAVATHTPDNATAVPYLGVPSVWQNTGYTGKNVKVGIIDTGIDYTHADFGGPGTTAAFAAAAANGATAADPSLFGPSAPRIKGGYDFAGDGYDASGDEGSPVPTPDVNPLDCSSAGHGTHVAGSAAGGGVTEAGAAYTGPYNASTGSKSWKVGPGVAPEADLYAYRVFGCFGSTDLTTQAIDRAVADGMDVINMSLGSPFGVSDDPSAVAARNAVGAGVVVVASAGNSGPNPYLAGSPSTGGGVVSVAAMDSTPSFAGAKLTFADGSTLASINANGVSPLPAGPFTVVVLKDDPATPSDESLGCSVHAYEYAGVAPGQNQLAVSYRNDCARVAKAIYAQKAGAAAALMVNNAAGYPPYEGQIVSNPDDGSAYTVTIPFLGVRNSDAAALVAQAGKTVTLAAQALANPGFTGYASFSSGGPRSYDSAARPSVTAPGVSIASAAVGTGTNSEILSGTSMAAPMVAGVAALVVQAHPTWSSQDVAGAIVTTAKSSKTAGYRQTLGGQGEVDPAAAVAAKVVLLGDAVKTPTGTIREPALSFGFAEPNETYRASKYVYLKNNGSSSQKFYLSSAATPQSQAGTVTISPRSVTVKARSTAKVKVTLTVKPSKIPTSEGSGFRFFEVSGSIKASSKSGNLAIPYLLVPRPAAQAKVTSASPIKSTVSSATVKISNHDGAIAAGLDVYAWGLSDPQELAKNSITAGMDIRAAGVQTFASDDMMVFAVNNWTRYSNAAGLEWDVAIDTNNDDSPEYIVFSADYGAMTAGSFNGRPVTFLYNVATGSASAQYNTVAPTDSSTVLMPVSISSLGLTAASGTFRYSVAGFTAQDASLVDDTLWASYNPFVAPVVGEGTSRTVKAEHSTTLTLPINKAAYADLKPLGVMIVAYDNRAGSKEALLIPGS